GSHPRSPPRRQPPAPGAAPAQPPAPPRDPRSRPDRRPGLAAGGHPRPSRVRRQRPGRPRGDLSGQHQRAHRPSRSRRPGRARALRRGRPAPRRAARHPRRGARAGGRPPPSHRLAGQAPGGPRTGGAGGARRRPRRAHPGHRGAAVSAVQSLRHARTFDSLRKHRNYRLYFGGQVISVTGTWVQNVAQAWLVVELTHSAVAVGLLAVCQFGPYAVLGLVGGVLTDRLDYRRVLLGTQSAMMLTAAALGALALLHAVQPWMVDAIAAANGLVLVLDTPARQSFTIQMVGRRELPNAVALTSSLFNASRIMGPGLGGLIIATTGVGICFVINAASFLAVLGGLLLMRPEELYPVARAERGESMLHAVLAGLRYVRQTPRVSLVLTMLLVVATVGINFNVLLPLLASRTLRSGPEVFGLLSATFGAGALAGALLAASMARAMMPLIVAAAAGFGVFELLLAPQTTVAGAVVLLVLVG